MSRSQPGVFENTVTYFQSYADQLDLRQIGLDFFKMIRTLELRGKIFYIDSWTNIYQPGVMLVKGAISLIHTIMNQSR